MLSKKIMVLVLAFLALGSYVQAQDMSLIPYRSVDKWGFASPDGKVVILPKYDDANWFSEGYASVKIGDKFGYINKIGKLVIPAKFTVAKPFRKGYLPNVGKSGGDSVLFAGASVMANGYEICINQKGNQMSACPAINENTSSENKMPIETVTREKVYSLPNSNGLFDKVTDDYKIAGNDETYYVAIKDGRYGVINSKFETTVPFQYTDIKVNRSGATPFLQVNQGGMFGIVLADGNISIAPEYTNMEVASSWDKKEYVIIQKGGKTYVKDISNRDIISTGYAGIIYDNAGGFIVTGDDQKKGYYFMDNHVIQPKYKDIRLMKNGQFLKVTTTSGKAGYISLAGEEYFID